MSTPMFEDVADLIVEHRRGQPERRNVDAHQPARLGQLLEDHHLVAQRHEVVRDGERGWPGADQRDALAIFLMRSFGEEFVMSSRLSAATRLRRQMATGFPSTRPRRHAGSQGRSHVRPRMPGKTFDSRLRRYDSVNRP